MFRFFLVSTLLILITLLQMGCDGPLARDGDSEGEVIKGHPNSTYTSRLIAPRMRANTFHASVHAYTYGETEGYVRHLARITKDAILGEPNSPTCFESDGLRAQLAFQTEARFADFVDDGPEVFFESLTKITEILTEEGIAVHLLLSIHNRPKKPWLGIDWEKEKWPSKDSERFVPYQPCREREVRGQTCLYDLIFENFHRKVIQQLVELELTDRLAVIYVFNEFDYENPPSGLANWSACQDAVLCRNEALAYTTVRGLRTAQGAAQGEVPIGTKFSNFDRASSAYLPYKGTDQLSFILQDVMAPSEMVLAYDAIWGPENLYDPANRQRLAPFLQGFEGGRLILGEFARRCVGPTGVLLQGRRTPPAEIRDLLKAWPQIRGANIFALNPVGPKDGCYALFDQLTKEGFFPGGKETLNAMWQQFQQFTQSQEPQTCTINGDPF